MNSLVIMLAIAASPLEDNNAIRARYGKPAMQIDARLQAAAQDHANFMAAHRSMNHFSNGGPQARAARHGFSGSVAENIAMGAENPWGLWVNSPGHFRSIIGNYNVCGIAVAHSGGTPYWCAVYGNAAAPKPPAPPSPIVFDAKTKEALRQLILEVLREELAKREQPPQQQYQAYQVPEYQPAPQYQPMFQPQYAPQTYGGCIGGRCGRR